MINVSYSFLNELPQMGHLRTKVLNASHNNIRNLWIGEMPADVEEVDLNSNDIRTDGLLVNWPDSIQRLNLSFNPVFSLDQIDSWPNRLISLNLSNTALRGVFNSAFLPETLQSLNLSNTNISRIYRFPAGLKEFIAIKTGLRILPEVCISIEKLVVSESFLMNWGIPIHWGKFLKHLDLNNNLLREVPRNLPEGLEFMNLSGNSIQRIKETFPKSLEMLHLNSNRILEIPADLLESKKLKFTIRNNCLLKPAMTTNCLTDSCQWIGNKYVISAKLIGSFWRRICLKQLIRIISRTGRLKSELLTVAMHPSRSGFFEDISKEWCPYQFPVAHPQLPGAPLPPKI